MSIWKRQRQYSTCNRLYLISGISTHNDSSNIRDDQNYGEENALLRGHGEKRAFVVAVNHMLFFSGNDQIVESTNRAYILGHEDFECEPATQDENDEGVYVVREKPKAPCEYRPLLRDSAETYVAFIPPTSV